MGETMRSPTGTLRVILNSRHCICSTVSQTDTPWFILNRSKQPYAEVVFPHRSGHLIVGRSTVIMIDI